MSHTHRSAPAGRAGRTPIALTACAAALLAAVACGGGTDDTQSIPQSTTPTASPQPAVAGEVTKSESAPTPVVTYASAEAEYRARHYPEAAQAFEIYVQQHPDNFFGHYMLGLSAWKAGDLDGARTALEESLSLDSTNVKTLLNLGRVLLDQGNVDDAFVRVSAAVGLDSTSAEARRMMARVQAAQGQRDSAIATYHLALSLDPADSWSMNNLGLLLIEQGRYEEALPPLARAVELRPDAPAFANNLGVALERTGHAAAAANAYRAALAADSTYSKAATSLARVEEHGIDSTNVDTVDLSALAAAFNEQIQAERATRVMATSPVTPDSVTPPEPSVTPDSATTPVPSVTPDSTRPPR